MKTSVKLTAAVLAIGLLAGCAGPNQSTNGANLACATVGALVGGAGGAAAGGGAGAAGGALAGAALGLLICPTEAQAEPMMAVANPVCTQTPPPGAILDAQGCAYDTDGDGIVAGVDLCRFTPAGVTVDRFGCAIDSDKDAVPDYLDLCPSTPLGVIVDTDGCPLPDQKILSLSGINFGFDQTVITNDSKEILLYAADAVKNTGPVLEVRVEGHTDNIGTDAYNLELSQRRAEAVVDYLVSQGANPDRLIPIGMGESLPVANNDTAAGRAANRRVDFVISQ